MYKILLIDDEEVILEGLSKIIDWTSLNCKIVGTAEDGKTGLQKIEDLEPHIILTDIRMPKISGLEMISLMKDLNPNCQIIILTGFRDFDYAQEAIRLGVLRFLLKPSKKQEIIEAIEQAICEIKKIHSQEKSLSQLQAQMKKFYGMKEIMNNKKEVASHLQEVDKATYLVHQGITYMKEYYAENIDLQTLADQLYVSTWHLSKLFKKETGSNFIDLLNEIRISEACRLLVESNHKIYEIAELVGYSDIAYFSRVFKKQTSLTPTQYRNQMHSS
ncbi:MAG: response regulator [Epulopiscium sp.]|nr:response regulator [Candidatus Epulonipiscium sp.]